MPKRVDDLADLHSGRGMGEESIAPTRRVEMRQGGGQARARDPRLDCMMDAARLFVIEDLGNGKGDGPRIGPVIETYTTLYRL